eukprot:CAMPEP_0185730478 /NCGR_PEP_ID=MMETSP1171-20130828/9970_1 /TAXON_ID=374046 /ORGANISM="Helicotheca tamensis, Strain CCMP826" /LENGTH=119 /DNA_ID=CAMNT_0028399525 /DNA_START=494 /DNA_END=853 /DNA_ORIENTATION=+
MTNQSSINIVATLCIAAPSTITSVDSQGRTPLDIARYYKAPVSVVRLLENFSKTYIKTLEQTEAQVERLVLNGKMELPKGGITEEVIIEMANESFGWRKGRALEYFNLKRSQRKKQITR